MKDKTKFRISLITSIIAIFILMGMFAIDRINKAQKTEDRLLSVESRLDSHDRIFPVLVAHTNGIYEYLGVMSGKQDTTITNDFFLDHDPIPPPAGLEMRIKRSLYQKIERPSEWEWNPETKKWEKSK